MRCTLLIPHLFWPRGQADALARGLELPAFAQLLARGAIERGPALTPEAWLCQAFEVERQQDWPIAPLTLALDDGAAGDTYWLRADPVHLRVTRDRLQLVDASLFDVAAEDAQALVGKLNGHFNPLGMAFHAPHPKRWYVKLPRVPELATHSISEAAGQEVQLHLPTGGEALAWHRLFNESQMLLHEHPVNEAREARGEPAINSVWFWGGGSRCAVRGRHFDAVWSDDAAAIALAAASGAHAAAVHTDATTWLQAAAAPKGALESHLVVLDATAGAVAYQDSTAWRTALENLEARWFAPLRGALRSGTLAELTLIALGEDSSMRCTNRRRDLLKFWRRPRALSAYA